MTRFLNPYNFVRPLPRPNLPDLTSDTRNQHLLWHCPPPPHDRYTGISGTIHCTMTAQSPVFVTDSECLHEDKSGHRTYGFFNVDGQDMIPASSLRGSVRSVFEAVTNSRWSVLPDQTMSYREEAGNANRLVPGFIIYRHEKGAWYVQLLKGYGGKQNFAAKVPYEVLEDSGFEHGEACKAILVRDENGVKVDKLLSIEAASQPKYHDATLGILCVTGDSIDNKKHERFFFDDGKLEPRKRVKKQVVKRYNELIQLTRKYHADIIQEIYDQKKTQKDASLSRYHVNMDKNLELILPDNPLISSKKSQFPVYVSLDHDDKVQYLAPASIPRVLERRSFYEILQDEGYSHLLPANDYEQLSPADRVFGWVHQDVEENDTKKDTDFKKRVAYKGRVRFTSAQVENKVEYPHDKVSLTILSSPKPTTTRFYVEPRDGVPAGINDRNRQKERWHKFTDRTLRFGRKGNMLRGRKVYRHHHRFNLNEAKQVGENSNQNRTIQGIHDIGTTYIFSIHFENLQTVELGALLWTLKLQHDGWQGYHRIGYAKPLGFGSVKIDVNAIEYMNYNRYDSDISSISFDESEYISQFMQAMIQLYGRTMFDTLENIQDLQALLGEPAIEAVYYPRSNQYRSKQGDENFRWFQDNKRVNRHNPNLAGPNIVLPYAADDTDGFPCVRWRNRQIEVDWD